MRVGYRGWETRIGDYGDCRKGPLAMPVHCNGEFESFLERGLKGPLYTSG